MLSKNQEDEITQILFSLEKYGLGDIKKSLKQDMLIATFILCVCFIEALVQYHFFKQTGWQAGDSEKNWSSFVDLFFPAKYIGKGAELYLNLRNKSVHNYSGNKFYTLGEYSDEGVATHLGVHPNGKIFLSVNSFVIAVDHAFFKFKSHLMADDAQKLIALGRANATPIFRQN